MSILSKYKTQYSTKVPTKGFGKVLKQYSLEHAALHEFANKGVPKDIVVKWYPSLESIYPEISNEAWTEEEADGFVDKILALALKLLRGIINIAKTIWKRLYAIGAKIYSWFVGIGKKSTSVKNNYHNAAAQCTQIINSVKAYCTDCINRGEVTNMELPSKVDIVLKACGLKQGPLDANSPSIVLQWLSTIKPSDIKGKLLKELTYSIPESQWMYFGYSTSIELFNKDHADKHREINSYFLKYALYARDYLSNERLLTTIRESIVGKSSVDIEYLKESVANKLVSPFVSFTKLGYSGNISNEKNLTHDAKSINDYILKSNDKLTGFQAAVSSVLPAIENANTGMMVKFQPTEYTRDEIVSYSNYIVNAVNVFETNRKHLWDGDKQLRDSFVLNELQITKLIQEIAPKLADNDINLIAKTMVELSQKTDKLISDAYMFWLQLTNAQTKLLNSQMDALTQFNPVI